MTCRQTAIHVQTNHCQESVAYLELGLLGGELGLLAEQLAADVAELAALEVERLHLRGHERVRLCETRLLRTHHLPHLVVDLECAHPQAHALARTAHLADRGRVEVGIRYVAIANLLDYGNLYMTQFDAYDTK